MSRVEHCIVVLLFEKFVFAFLLIPAKALIHLNSILGMDGTCCVNFDFFKGS